MNAFACIKGVVLYNEPVNMTITITFFSFVVAFIITRPFVMKYAYSLNKKILKLNL